MQPCEKRSQQNRKISGCPTTLIDADLDSVYDSISVLTNVATGRPGLSLRKVLDRRNQTPVVAKVFHKKLIRQMDILREYNICQFLTAHPNIIETYMGLFVSADSYFFIQVVLFLDWCLDSTSSWP